MTDATEVAAEAVAATESGAGKVVSAVHETIDRLHAETFNGTKLGWDVELWNLVHGFKEKLKAEFEAAIGKIKETL